MTTPFKVRFKLQETDLLCSDLNKPYLPEHGKIYTVVLQYDSLSKLYNFIRTYVVLQEFPSYNSYTLDSFDIISNDIEGERAPKLEPSRGFITQQVNIIN